MPNKPKAMRDAVAYIRVSTEDQGENGAGLDLQMTRIEAFARIEGFRIVRVYRDVHTAADEAPLKRPGCLAACKHSKARQLPIIVDGLDRFSRKTKVLEELVVNGKLKVISARSGEGAGRAVIVAEAARAQAEVERISRTTKDGLRRARERGVRLGNPINLPEAQKKGAASNRGKAERHARELAPVVKEIRASGSTTKEAIANELNKRAYRTARGERWNKDRIRRVLDRIADLERVAELQRHEPERVAQGLERSGVLAELDEHNGEEQDSDNKMVGMF